MQTRSKIILTAAALISLMALTSLNAATVSWTNAGGAGDGNWATNTNWDSGTVPTDDDQVGIGIGFTVNYNVTTNSGDLQPTVLGLNGTLNVIEPFRANSRSINVGSTGTLGGGSYYLGGGTFSFIAGAAATMENWIQGGTNVFNFQLNAAGFTTLTPEEFSIAGFSSIANATYNVDMATYTGSADTTIVLANFGSDSAGINNTSFQTAGINVTNTVGYSGSYLQWNDTDDAIELVVVPEPVTYTLIGGFFAFGVVMLHRRR